MPIRPEFYVSLKGKQYPVYAGVLIAAMEAGLKSLTVAHVQLPAEENGHVAVMKARAEFEDGRVFEDYGDCSPRNTSPQIATASIRMASTRAKGRVLRDAIGLGETLKEELPDDEENGAVRTHAASPAAAPPRVAVQSAQSAPVGRSEAPATGVKCVIDDCKIMLTENQINKSQNEANMNLCTVHLAKMKAGIAG